MEIFKELQFTHTYWAFLLPVILMAFDVITGYYNAWKNGDIKSSKMRDGLGKKIAEICYIAIAGLIGIAFCLDKVVYLVSFYVIYMELLSIAENCDKLGFPMPKAWKEKLNNKEEE
ncbi:phage holin family protein [uncultured Thomasclavelia sp.]|uniref:phage holin family protein n=1 Tax=uncultured Thomasclavelia sp. TaxID=3025759 RepID=UPI0025976387|nr:phage holin family protein [uncultured Thomasclavelia sp.]